MVHKTSLVCKSLGYFNALPGSELVSGGILHSVLPWDCICRLWICSIDPKLGTSAWRKRAASVEDLCCEILLVGASTASPLFKKTLLLLSLHCTSVEEAFFRLFTFSFPGEIFL